MTKTQHTPGPWDVHGDSHTLVGARDGKMMLANTLHEHVVPRYCRSKAEAQANARLIAAAPALLEAARQVAWKLNRNTDQGPALIDRNDACFRMLVEAIELAY